MTSVTIEVDAKNKRLRFRGDAIAAGEHVFLKVVGYGDRIGVGGRDLRLRLCDGIGCHGLVAIFPHLETDAWESDEAGNAVCEINLNSIELLRAARAGSGVFCDVILDAPGLNTEYGQTSVFVAYWPRRIGADVPYSLDEYPDIVRQLQQTVAALTNRIVQEEGTVAGHIGNSQIHVSQYDRAKWNAAAETKPLAGEVFSGSSLMTNYGLMKAVGDIIEKLGGTIR